MVNVGVCLECMNAFPSKTIRPQNQSPLLNSFLFLHPYFFLLTFSSSLSVFLCPCACVTVGMCRAWQRYTVFCAVSESTSSPAADSDKGEFKNILLHKIVFKKTFVSLADKLL